MNNVKKHIYLVMTMVIIMVMTMLPAAASSQPDIKVEVNGTEVVFQSPLILEKSRITVAAKDIIKLLGAWTNPDTAVNGKFYIEDKYTTVELSVNDRIALVHKKYDFSGIPLKVTLEVPPSLVNGEFYIPLRFVAESLGAVVGWEQETRTAVISTDAGITPVETPAEYTVVTEKDIENSPVLHEWYRSNYMQKGIYSVTDQGDTYILVSAGERPTGGYGLEIESATVVRPGSLYLTAKVIKPDPNADVIMVLTYPNRLIKLEDQTFEVIDGEIFE